MKHTFSFLRLLALAGESCALPLVGGQAVMEGVMMRNGDAYALALRRPDGEIVAVKFLDNDETPGLGQKVKDAAFQDQFAGRAASEMTLSDIDGLSGATFSTNGALNGVNAAIKAYQTITGEG